jgi:adenosylmethionine-8-amino-7-oxononanoate aminotransferase
LRDATRRQRVLLIFDEVITGFRWSRGGAQARYGIVPDLTVLAKILAGGLPGGAVVGKKDVLDQIDPAAAKSAGREKIGHQGTFNANPLCARRPSRRCRCWRRTTRVRAPEATAKDCATGCAVASWRKACPGASTARRPYS